MTVIQQYHLSPRLHLQAFHWQRLVNSDWALQEKRYYTGNGARGCNWWLVMTNFTCVKYFTSMLQLWQMWHTHILKRHLCWYVTPHRMVNSFDIPKVRSACIVRVRDSMWLPQLAFTARLSCVYTLFVTETIGTQNSPKFYQKMTRNCRVKPFNPYPANVQNMVSSYES